MQLYNTPGEIFEWSPWLRSLSLGSDRDQIDSFLEERMTIMTRNSSALSGGKGGDERFNVQCNDEHSYGPCDDSCGVINNCDKNISNSCGEIQNKEYVDIQLFSRGRRRKIENLSEDAVWNKVTKCHIILCYFVL